MIGAQDRLQPLLSRVSYKGRGQRSWSNGLRPVCTFPSVISLTKAIVNWLTICEGHRSKELEYHPRFHNYPWADEWQLGGPWRGLTPDDYNVDGPVHVILILVLNSIIRWFIITNINFNIITRSRLTPVDYNFDWTVVVILIHAIYIIIIDKDGDCGKNQVAWRKDIAAKYERSIWRSLYRSGTKFWHITVFSLKPLVIRVHSKKDYFQKNIDF